MIGDYTMFRLHAFDYNSKQRVYLVRFSTMKEQEPKDILLTKQSYL